MNRRLAATGLVFGAGLLVMGTAAFARACRLRVRMTLTDPVVYTKPWQSSQKVWALIPKERMSIGGWSGILEDRCVPSDESLFNKFRDHAAGLK